MSVKIRTSALPALAQCPRYESDPNGSDYTAAGTDRHAVVSQLLSTGDKAVLEKLPQEDREGVEWAWEQIQIKAPMSDYPIQSEEKASFITPDFEEIFGTPDVVCGPVVFDLKWRERDYQAQMAGYALMVLQRAAWPEVTVHVLFAEPRRVTTYTFTEESALAIVLPIIDRASSPDAKPSACDYCGWCAKRLTCPAVIDKVNLVVANRDDWQLSTWHAYEIESAAEMGKALRIARVLADWCEAVEHHAKEMAAKKGIVPTGYKLQTRQGNRYITSVSDAFSRAGVPQDRFLAACEIKLSRLAEVYAEINVMKKAPAERELEAKLGDVVQRKGSTISLVAEKSEK